MNTPSPQITPSAPITAPVEATTPSEAGTVEQRTAALYEELRGEPLQPAGDDTDDATGAPVAAPAPVASPADSSAEARRLERRARLDAMTQAERQNVDRKERQAAYDKQQRDLTAAQRRAEEADARAAAGIDRSVLKDPLKVLRLLENEGISAVDVGNAIRESLTNPELTASRAAREAISPELAAVRHENAQMKQQLDQLLSLHQQTQSRIAEQQHTEAFVQFTGASKERAPLASALLTHDREEFLQLATLAAEAVPPGAGPAALLDKLEDLLDGDVRKIAQKYAAVYGPSAIPSPAPQTRPGAVQPNTVSNSLAQGRTTLVEEENLDRLPVEERVRRLLKAM